MEKFKVKYYFSNDLFVTRVIEVASQEDANNYTFEKGSIQFTDVKGVYHNFQTDNVILISVSKFKPATVVRGF
jgi:hypothetical protein